VEWGRWKQNPQKFCKVFSQHLPCILSQMPCKRNTCVDKRKHANNLSKRRKESKHH
jgi:hypothetical protein